MFKFIILFVAFISPFFTSFNTNASTVDYVNVSDTSTIEEDFKLLELDINNYYLNEPNLEDYRDLPNGSDLYFEDVLKRDEFYFVALSQTYLEDTKEFQVYLYMYNQIPHSFKQQEYDYLYSVKIDYKLNNLTNTNYLLLPLSKVDERGLYKFKAFTYKADITSVDLEITKASIRCDNHTITKDYSFTANINNQLVDNNYNITLKFNSTLILKEYTAVEVYLDKDSGWDQFCEDAMNWFGGEWTSVKVVFYNFNFPNNIVPDSIDYANFTYDKKTTKSKNSMVYEEFTETLDNSYLPGDNTINVSDHSSKFYFPTFYIGNRIKDNQFGSLEFTNEQIKLFENYKCSILLDVLNYTETKHLTTKYEEFQKITNIDLLELWYTKDGVQYKCQVIADEVDPSPIVPEVATPWYMQLLDWILKHPFEALLYFVGIVVGLPLIISIAPSIFSIIIMILYKFVSFFVEMFKFIINSILKIFRL